MNGMCAACADPSDDANCATAYSGAFICIEGSCTPGDCRKNSDCTPTGKLCGVTTPYTCGGCTTDPQCQAAYADGGTSICSTPGLCVPGSCTNQGSACLANPDDVCCSGECVPGNCCKQSDCTQPDEGCQSNVCTCPAAASSTYYVDPQNGNDTVGTGYSSTGGGCAFRSLTRAFAVIGATAPAGARVLILNTTPVGPAETYPITVSANVTIESAVPATASTIYLVKGLAGFTLSTGVTMQNLVINGNGDSGIGITVTTTSTTPTANSLNNVTIENTGGHGIEVTANGLLAIGSNVVVKNAGTATVPASGLFLSGTGHAEITLGNTDIATQFTGNTEAGIDVTAGGSIAIGPVAGGTLDPVAVLSGNGKGGLLIGQTPAAKLAGNVITNLEVTGTTGGSGILVTGGSALTLRHSTVSASMKNGFEVDTYGTGTSANNDLTLIDLGTTASSGGNTFQYPAGAMQNAGSGICLEILATAKQELTAVGNVFSAANCGTMAATLVHTAGSCAAKADYGINGTGATNTILLTKCM